MKKQHLANIHVYRYLGGIIYIQPVVSSLSCTPLQHFWSSYHHLDEFLCCSCVSRILNKCSHPTPKALWNQACSVQWRESWFWIKGNICTNSHSHALCVCVCVCCESFLWTALLNKEAFLFYLTQMYACVCGCCSDANLTDVESVESYYSLQSLQPVTTIASLKKAVWMYHMELI